MLNFLQEGIKKLIPSVAQVKEKIVEDKVKIHSYLDDLLETVARYTPRVIVAFLVLIFGLWIIKRMARVAEIAMTKRDLDISLRGFLKSLTSIGLKIILIVTVAGMLGIGTASFVTILGAAGLAVGLALQGSLSNFAGGVLILIFKPFKVGDTIEAGGQSGEVLEIQIFNTILLTMDHKTIILPNGPLSNGTIVNTTRHGNLRTEILLHISFENNLNEVKKIIELVLSHNEKVIQYLKPGIFFGEVSDGSITIAVKPYCMPDDTVLLKSELYQQFKEAFEKQNVKAPIPQRIVQNK